MQDFLLTMDLSYDMGIIPKGTYVNSHMIFLNTGPGQNTQFASHNSLQWDFSGAIPMLPRKCGMAGVPNSCVP